GDPIPIGGVVPRLSLKPGKAKRLKLKFVPPASLPPGTYTLRVAFDPDNLIGDPNTGNNVVDTGVTIQSGARGRRRRHAAVEEARTGRADGPPPDVGGIGEAPCDADDRPRPRPIPPSSGRGPGAERGAGP